MLRVHPTIYTAHPLAWRQLLTDLGLAVSGADSAPPVAPSPEGTPTKFDAGAGRVAVHPVAAGQAEFVAFGVEVGDVAEFARRTNLWAAEAAHTPLASPPSGQGADRTCVISAGDGLSFTATTARRSADGSWTVETTADPQLGVQLLWYTPDRAAAKAALTGIGARPLPIAPAATDHVAAADDAYCFSAKNGGTFGVLSSAKAPHPVLSFTYDGDLSALAQRLAAAGHRLSTLTDRSLSVAVPGSLAGSTLSVRTAVVP